MGTGKLDILECAACQYGKHHTTPHKSKTVKKVCEGELKKNTLAPGQLLFSDQYSRRIEGRAFGSRGADASSGKVQGGTIFCDTASSYLHVNHQVGFTAEETICSEIKFEREMMTN
jgi:hypothetical protein